VEVAVPVLGQGLGLERRGGGGGVEGGGGGEAKADE
jgi:hypothetical protein